MAIPFPIFKGPDLARYPSQLVPTPEDGSFRFAERLFYTKEVRGPQAQALIFAQLFTRGTVWALPPLNGFFWVEETTVTPEKGGISKVRTTFAWTGIVPVHEWSITPFEINPPLVRHPFFSTLSANDIQQVWSTFQTISAQGLAALQAAIAASGDSTLQTSLLVKMLQGKETWYLVGIKYVWTQYYTSWTGLTRRGGFREQPYLSVDGVGPGTAYLPRTSWDYLREADEMVWNNGLYKVTRTWLGAPGGFWDSDLYGTTPQ